MVKHSTKTSSPLQTIVSGVSSGTPYKFKVLAKNSVGVSAFSAVVTIYAA
jgi:hypothetical protein